MTTWPQWNKSPPAEAPPAGTGLSQFVAWAAMGAARRWVKVKNRQHPTFRRVLYKFQIEDNSATVQE
jgi:hypothetical protein